MELLKSFIHYFTLLVVATLICSSLYIVVLWGTDTYICISYVWGVLALSAICAAASLIFPLASRKGEISKARMLSLQLLLFVIVNIAAFITGIICRWFSLENKRSLIGMELVIIAVFILVNLISYFLDCKTASKMNEQLKRLRNN